MVTWTESHDRYTLRASEWEWAFAYALLAIGLFALPWVNPRAFDLALCSFPSMVLLVLAARSLRVAWVEVPLQGGRVRWGIGGSEETAEPVPVDRFEVDPVLRPMRHGDPHRYTVVAVLPDGSRHRVLGAWDCFPPTRAQALAAQLNGILGREERPPDLDLDSEGRVRHERTMTGCLLVGALLVLLLVIAARIM